MRVVAQEEDFVPSLSSEEKYGFILLEHEPCYRTIDAYSNHFGLSNKRVPLPYVQYLICYTRKDNEYFFHSFQDGGLRVYFSDKPLENLEQKVSCPWLEGKYLNSVRNGMICTTHEFDPDVTNKGKIIYKKSSKKLFDIVDYQISTFWGMQHCLDNNGPDFCKDFLEAKVEEICGEKFKKLSKVSSASNSFLYFLNKTKSILSRINTNRLYPTGKTVFINKEFHKDWEIKEQNHIIESLNEFKDAFLRGMK
ncbi:MAG: hypothetical protein EKK64_04400 [Neisseriaceae bacterium]|nr:MAG: hypothetical protein EKK64_04400 [Neisseriaceae bacterium]